MSSQIWLDCVIKEYRKQINENKTTMKIKQKKSQESEREQ